LTNRTFNVLLITQGLRYVFMMLLFIWMKEFWMDTHMQSTIVLTEFTNL